MGTAPSPISRDATLLYALAGKTHRLAIQAKERRGIEEDTTKRFVLGEQARAWTAVEAILMRALSHFGDQADADAGAAVFRMLTKKGEEYRAAAAALAHVQPGQMGYNRAVGCDEHAGVFLRVSGLATDLRAVMG